MKDEKTHYSTVDESLSEQHICGRASIFCIVRKNWAYAPTTSGSYSRQAGWLAGWLADEMWVDFKIFKILYRLNYSDFYFVIMLLAQKTYRTRIKFRGVQIFVVFVAYLFPTKINPP